MPDNEDIETEPQDKTVPYERFSKVAEERKTLKTQYSTLNEQYGTLRDQLHTTQAELKTALEWKSKYEQLESSFVSYKDQIKEESALGALGLSDPEAIDVARFYHSRTPEENRPALTEWLKAIQAKPETIPPGLAPYLQSTKTDTKLPSQRGSTTTQPTAPSTLDPSTLRGLSTSEYKERREEALKAYRARYK